MNQVFEIRIVGEIPADSHDLAAEAHVAAKAPINALVETLAGMGLLAVTRSIRTVRKNAPVMTAKLPVEPIAETTPLKREE